MKITRHAVVRGRERVGLSLKPFIALAARAFEVGVRQEECAGALGRWLAGIYLSQLKVNNARIYGDHCYLFMGRTLITVIHVPQGLRRTVRAIEARRQRNKEE